MTRWAGYPGNGGSGMSGAAISRRRLLRLTAYAAPAALLLDVGVLARAAGATPLPLCCAGGGLRGFYYSNNAGAPGWPRHAPDETRSGETVCSAAGWPGAGIAAPFSVRWVGRLCIGDTGTYRFRLLVDGSPGTQGRWMIRLPGKKGNGWSHFKDGEEAELPLAGGCPATYDVDIIYHHTDRDGAPSVCFQWRRGGVWAPIPIAHLIPSP